MPDREKRSLTPAEAITAAYLKIVRNVPTMDIATAFNVNLGRVSEATNALEYAAGNIDEVRKLAPPKEGR